MVLYILASLCHLYQRGTLGFLEIKYRVIWTKSRNKDFFYSADHKSLVSFIKVKKVPFPFTSFSLQCKPSMHWKKNHCGADRPGFFVFVLFFLVDGVKSLFNC